MATFKKRGSTWTAEVRRLGVKDCAKFDTKAEAVAWELKREADIQIGARRGIIPHTLREALKRYATDVSPSKGGSRWEISQDEIDRVTLALNYEPGMSATMTTQRVAVAFLVALETGIRSGEIMGIRWADVHVKERFVRLRKTQE